jgi:hypothetical protein
MSLPDGDYFILDKFNEFVTANSSDGPLILANFTGSDTQQVKSSLSTVLPSTSLMILSVEGHTGRGCCTNFAQCSLSALHWVFTKKYSSNLLATSMVHQRNDRCGLVSVGSIVSHGIRKNSTLTYYSQVITVIESGWPLLG